MRDSFKEFIETCFDIKIFLQVRSYQLFDYEDGDYAVFEVAKVYDPRKLLEIAGKLEVRIFAEGDRVKIHVYEDYQEY